jgi:hypothetical protein
MTPRGIRGNNPTNIKREDGVVWKGQTAEQTDPVFVTFKTVPYGYRAAAIILDAYQRKHGLYTVDGMIRRWSATDQDAYVANVAKACGVKPNEHFLLRASLHLRTMLRAMTIQENGECPYPDFTIDQGIALAWADRPITSASS